ncbi:UDP-2,4-diacetamido-2,4,6-trideoxy-beta-L-altropyranose hydrolase [Candidatus Aerophobetes bacterium]|uniref:UDP-2,4-diacetamido-2,4, 6-trideoxy-beta-L-altropyranose hydrolase n=1 Tax=Aerophobetes bacterium TaxID=2030807 RepID=A0A497E2Q3_UNCAE|nr:MAG: UDP-2,4-diacetamido-2,4,6-trideoxy-beta-L-altropyranose hydrolase [Candidatus Aerophobetes bacterium]
MTKITGKILLIRADASTKIGTGHLMRCLALAQAWKDAGGEVAFITACRNEGLLERLREEGFEVHLLSSSYPEPGDWEVTKNVIAGHPDAWVVLDGYHFDEVYQKRIKDAGNRLLVIDDMAHLNHYYADIVLNQNLHAEDLSYHCEPYTRLLLGTKYVLLRREFLKWKGWKREIPDIAKKVLVTLGGSDPENVTLKIIQALQRADISDLEVTVVIGASNPHADTLEEATRQSCIPVRLVRNVKNMPKLMAWADVAVSSAGTTVWELAFMGVPTMVVITTPIEEFLSSGVEKYGLFASMGWFNRLYAHQLTKALNELIQDEEVRRNMATLSRHFVDGAGCDRVLEHLSTRKGQK